MADRREQILDHFSSRAGIRCKDRSVVRENMRLRKWPAKMVDVSKANGECSMTKTRRNILTLMGLAVAATPAIAAEDFNTMITDSDRPGVPGLAQPSLEFQEKVARSLKKLADAILAGDASARKLNINSDVGFDDWIQHEVKITVEIPIVTDVPVT